MDPFDDFLGFVALEELDVEGFEQEFLQGSEVAEPATPEFAEEVGAGDQQEEPEQGFPFDFDAEEDEKAVLPAGNHTGTGATVETEVEDADQQEQSPVFAEGGVADAQADEPEYQEDGYRFVHVGVLGVVLPGFGWGYSGGFCRGKFVVGGTELAGVFGSGELAGGAGRIGGLEFVGVLSDRLGRVYRLEFVGGWKEGFAVGAVFGQHRAVGRYGFGGKHFGNEVGRGHGQAQDSSDEENVFLFIGAVEPEGAQYDQQEGEEGVPQAHGAVFAGVIGATGVADFTGLVQNAADAVGRSGGNGCAEQQWKGQEQEG